MLIKVKVLTKSKKQQVIEKEKATNLENEKSSGFAFVLEVQVKAKPEQGKANQEVLTLLAKHFNISLDKLKIIKGHKTPNKIIKSFK
ncbi:hypothetical protein COX24_01940 [bacterium (Candidatus Gribaldobacteria) CG23_combo_of_CG06-09_8_20_14_all_37_87_8]|uniref:Uncharacterized protein n=2 Tax=Candidatus Gribaldobacteria TaxID=2798536 RepID=A0A2G9ZF00_9BACT|nr:MAG: hypothetical protein AUJ25_02305 [Parcubacteria group bacterium CG1_02_37_13]PIP31737.1 MAG: hypothetical protein COX24_01940 [bacterium (Candidatus Gribaldobacteria) CG23_combo_of_CG06-09_8_20_14_all_37_87_8]PIR90791.1 MAG: hypothetical protein COU05_00170 [bacterium (Candidatus Gribaldobacteria) CG10_big_fil_rev_8_21_14_0_10_37_21]